MHQLFRVVRLPIVAGGLLGYAMGTLLAIADGGLFNAPRLIIGYLLIFLADLSTHYSNDFYDSESDETANGKVFGGSNLLVEKPMLRPAALTLASVCSVASVALSVIGVALFTLPWVFLAIAVSANLLGWAYSTPPLRLVSRGFGEVSIALGTGLIIPAAGYLAALPRMDIRLLLFLAPFILYGFVLSLSLELPDLEADLATGKLNLVARLGRRWAYTMILFLCGASSGLLTLGSYLFKLAAPWMFTVFSFAPLTASLYGYRRGGMDRGAADSISMYNILSLFVLIALVDGGLLGELWIVENI